MRNQTITNLLKMYHETRNAITNTAAQQDAGHLAAAEAANIMIMLIDDFMDRARVLNPTAATFHYFTTEIYNDYAMMTA